VQKLTVNTIAAASLSAEEAGLLLPLAAQAAIKGKAEIDNAKAKGAAALAVMVAGFASDEVAARPWAFDIAASDGSVHYHVDCMGLAEYGETEGAWRYNSEGAISKASQTAYKNGLSAAFFNLPASVPAVWTMISKAVPMARAIREEGMVATIEDGELKLTGGTGERADAMRGAKSLSALAKLAKGETGTGRETHGNAKGDSASDGETRLATPAEVMALAARLCEGVAKGDEALSGTALSFARRIADLVKANPEAFAED
jgi:hypothetical protein